MSTRREWNHRQEAFGDQYRRVVCRNCHVVMNDSEPSQLEGEFFHSTTFGDGMDNPCKNRGKSFGIGDKEVDLFVRKRERRSAKRATGRSTVKG